MMTTEIVVTWVSASVVGVVSLLQAAVSILEKKRFNRELKDLEALENRISIQRSIERIRSAWGHDAGVLNWSFILQAIFSVIAFSLLVWWSIYLVNQMFYEWAALSASFALLSVSVTIFVWQGIKYKSERLDGLKVLTEREDEPDANLSLGKNNETQVVQETNNDFDKSLSVQKKARLPEDSVLRRHHISLMVSQIEDEFGERPADSVLVRHYDQLVLSELTSRLEIDEQSYFSG